jgi:hypothetical protein
VPNASATYVVSGESSLGCTGFDTLQVFYGTFPDLNAGQDQSVCFGDEVILYGTGGIFMSWSNNIADSIPFVPQQSGSYVLTGASNEGCIGTDTVYVSVNDASSNTITASAIDSYTLNGQTYTTSGSYTQVLINAAGCDSLLTLNLTLDFTGLDENEQQFSLYPNPVKDIFVLTVVPKLIGQEIQMMNIEGKSVISPMISAVNQSINVQYLPSGIYFVKIGEVVQKLLVE